MTKNFVSAAELMCRVLGMPDYKFAVIGHPISSASDEQLAEYALALLAILAVVAQLFRHPGWGARTQ
jgi:hypothetical protein